MLKGNIWWIIIGILMGGACSLYSHDLAYLAIVMMFLLTMLLVVRFAEWIVNCATGDRLPN